MSQFPKDSVFLPSEQPLPSKPTLLSLWMHKYGRPNRLTVEYRATGTDTAETVILLEAMPSEGRAGQRIEVTRGDLLTNNSYGSAPGQDVQLILSYAHVADWTECGRTRLDAWLAWEKKEARDIAEYKRLHAKFGSVI